MTLALTKFLWFSGLIAGVLFITVVKHVLHTKILEIGYPIIYWILLLAPIVITMTPQYRRYEKSREKHG